MGTDHDVRYKNKTPQPDNQKELAPSLTLSVWHPGLTGFAAHSDTSVARTFCDNWITSESTCSQRVRD